MDFDKRPRTGGELERLDTNNIAVKPQLGPGSSYPEKAGLSCKDGGWRGFPPTSVDY